MKKLLIFIICICGAMASMQAQNMGNLAARKLQMAEFAITNLYVDSVDENKNTYFPIEKRVEIIQKFYRNEPRIKVYSYDCLTIDFARQVDAQFIVRGIRTVKDFEYEETIADINRKLAGIETILLFTEPELTCISSTTVRELLQFGKDISQFIPEGMEIN